MGYVIIPLVCGKVRPNGPMQLRTNVSEPKEIKEKSK